MAALLRQATRSLTGTLRLGLARKSSRKTTEWSCRSVQTFRCKTRSPSAGKSGHVSEQFKFSALQKNFFSTLTLNLKHPHFLPAASRGGKTYHHPTELHFYWTSSHSFNAGKENTQWNVSLLADSLIKTYGRWWVSSLWPFSDSIFNHQSTSKPFLTPCGEIGSVPSLNQLPQPGLIGIPAVKEAFIILLSSGLIFPLPVTHHHKYIVMRSLLHTHRETHTFPDR